MFLRNSLRMNCVLLAVCGIAQAEDWHQFRGPGSNGVVQGVNLPEVWGADSNLKWKAEIPGEGWSSPIVVGQKVILTTAVSSGQKNRASEHAWKVICLDASSGHQLWEKEAIHGKPRLGTHRDNTYASETPATDGQHIVAYFGMMGVYCYDLDGNELWTKDLGNFPMRNEWGTSSSPIIHDGLVFLQVDNEQASFLVALNVGTGEEVWRQRRDESSNWGSPIIWKNTLRTELVTSGGTIRSYNPKDGLLLWQMKLNKGGVSSTPSGSDNLLVVGNQGRDGAGMAAIKAGAQGDISLEPGEHNNANVLWSTTEFGPQRSSPLVIAGQVFLLGGRGGILTCLDATNGAKIYEERLPAAGAFWASPWSYNGLVYCPDEKGNTFVLKPGPKLELVRVNKLTEESGRYWATSAVAEGTLFIRSTNMLYAVPAQ